MARWSPTIEPLAPVASNSAMLTGALAGANALTDALDKRRTLTREQQRYEEEQRRRAMMDARDESRYQQGLAHQTEREKVQDAQTALENALTGTRMTRELQDSNYTQGETQGDQLAKLRPAAAAGVSGPMATLMGDLGTGLQKNTQTVTLPSQVGGGTWRRDPSQTPQAQAAQRSQLERLARENFEREIMASNQKFQASENQKSRNVTMASLARDRFQPVATAAGYMAFDPKTGAFTPAMANGQPVVPVGGRSAQSQANEAALYGSQMSSALQTLNSVKDSDKPFGMFTQAGLNQAGQGFTGDLLAGLGRKALSPEQQQVNNARDQFAASAVYAFSGKTATNPEKATMRSLFFMQPGEEGDALARQKAGNREVATLAMQARTSGRTLDMASAAKHLLGKGYSEQEVSSILGSLTPYLNGQPAGGMQP